MTALEAIVDRCGDGERDDLIGWVEALHLAANDVVARWESGDLAGAVNELHAVLAEGESGF